jgi:hypothetical protein
VADIVIPVLHPVPVPRRFRPGTRIAVAFARALTPIRVRSVPAGSMRPWSPACMDSPAGFGGGTGRTSVFEGRTWHRVNRIAFGADGWTRREDTPLAEAIAALAGLHAHMAQAAGFGHWTPLAQGGKIIGGGDAELDPSSPWIAPARAALLRYADSDMLACGDAMYLAAGLPCLGGIHAPTLCGAAAAWADPAAWMLTRHDRVSDHVRFVGRLQRDDEADRFAYLAGLVERDCAGIAPDDRCAALFANRLPGMLDDLLQAGMRRWARTVPPAEHAALREARDALAHRGGLGAIGAIAPEDRDATIRDCLAVVRRVDAIDPTAAEPAREWRAYAEEVALPGPAADGASFEADAARLGNLVP